MNNTHPLLVKANKIRKSVVDVCVKNEAGHIAPSLSCVDILVALYYDSLELDEDNWDNRDRLVMSKAHGAYGLYAILADKKLIEKAEWTGFYKSSSLKGCSERDTDAGIEAGCGSLGHGLPQAVGIAYGAKLQSKQYKVYCIVGDGEMQEGSNWEALQFAVKYRLSNLAIIIDSNGLQAMDTLDNIMTLTGNTDDLYQKVKGFSADCKKVDGHDLTQLVNNFRSFKQNKNLTLPQVFIAKTIKGYGLKCMENIPKFHFRLPSADELKKGNRYE